MTRLSLVAVLATATLVSGVNAIELTDYTVTESQYEEAYINGKFHWQDGNQAEGSYNGDVSAYYETIYSTAPFVWFLRGDVAGEINKGSDKDSEKDTKYNTEIKTTVDKYFDNEANKLFGYGELNLGYKKEYNFAPNDEYVDVTVGIGYGRIYNATPLAKAVRIVEDLKKYNQITGEPSPEHYVKLAKLLDESKEKEYRSKYGEDEYKKYWYKDIEAVLKESGIIAGESLGAFGIVKIDEILGETGQRAVGSRKHGWVVRAGITKQVSDYDGVEADAGLKASFEYALPIGLKSQFTEFAEYTASLEDDTAGHKFINKMSYLYEVSDMIDWDNRFDVEFSKPSSDASYYRKYEFVTGYLFHLTNKLDFTADLTLAKESTEDDLNRAFNVGVRYRLK